MKLETEMEMLDRSSRLNTSYGDLEKAGKIGDRGTLYRRYEAEEAKNKKKTQQSSSAEGMIQENALRQEDFPGGFY